MRASMPAILMTNWARRARAEVLGCVGHPLRSAWTWREWSDPLLRGESSVFVSDNVRAPSAFARRNRLDRSRRCSAGTQCYHECFRVGQVIVAVDEIKRLHGFAGDTQEFLEQGPDAEHDKERVPAADEVDTVDPGFQSSSGRRAASAWDQGRRRSEARAPDPVPVPKVRKSIPLRGGRVATLCPVMVKRHVPSSNLALYVRR